MELRDYWLILNRRKWVVIVTLVFTLAATVAGTLLMTPRYAAAATLRVETATTGSVDFLNYDLDYADRLMNTYINLAITRPVLQELAQRLELTEPLSEIASSFELEIPANTELIRIDAEHPDPEQAAAIANTLAAILIEERERVNTGENPAYEYQVTVVEPATISELPATPNRALNLALGLLVGTVGGLGLAFLFENLDSSLYTVEQIEGATGLLTLAHIPTVKKSKAKKRFTSNDSSSQEEAFRRLRAGILAQTQVSPLKTLLVTSSGSGEDAATVAANLALATARAGEKVIVVDADFRQPMMHTLFGLPNKGGLSNFLRAEERLEGVLQNSSYPNVSVLTSGTHTDQLESFSSAHVERLLIELKERFCWIVLSAPPLLKTADALELASKVDGVVLTIKRQQTQKDAAQRACQYLAGVKSQTLGVVVTE